jgi:hypothetical protein
MISKNEGQVIGIGQTAHLSLRVSVATLARVVFPSPENGEPMLALEHKATLLTSDEEARIVVKAQPFGGAVRLHDYTQLQSLVENFHFDSEHSHSERDFRIYIRPADWDVVREYCLRNFNLEGNSDIESDPIRELVEEFDNVLKIELLPNQYTLKPLKTVIENEPVPTGNVDASGLPAVRVYRVFETKIIDPDLIQAMVTSSEKHSNDDLRNRALNDAQKGGRGWANAMLVVPIQKVRAAYMAILPENRNAPLPFEDTLLDSNVPAILEDIFVPKYRDINLDPKG